MHMSKHTPPIFAISGSFDYLRTRELNRLILEHSEKGWVIEYVDGADIESLITALSPNPFMATDTHSLVVVSHPDKVKIDFFESFYKNTDKNIIALLIYEGDPKAKSPLADFLKKLGSSHKTYSTPKLWDMERVAIDFCMSEAHRQGKVLPMNLAKALVSVEGTDLGFLSFEILKMVMLADVNGESEITRDCVMKSKASISEMSIVPLVDAVAYRNRVKIIKTMDMIKKTFRGDPSMAVASYLFNAAVNWLCVIDLRDRGLDHDSAAAELGVNAWFYKNKMVPQANLWGREDISLLMSILGDTKRSVLSGQINPWVVFSSRILQLCR